MPAKVGELLISKIIIDAVEDGRLIAYKPDKPNYDSATVVLDADVFRKSVTSQDSAASIEVVDRYSNHNCVNCMTAESGFCFRFHTLKSKNLFQTNK